LTYPARSKEWAAIDQKTHARGSPLVSIQIAPTGDVAGNHGDLHGAYTISADRAVADSLFK